jgi:hypothetical protein
MRVIRDMALVVVGVGACSLVLSGQAPDATQVLAAAREALGGDKNLTAIRTFVASGRTRQLRGNNLVPIEFEISCELPDRFVRKDEIPAQDTDLTVTGFSGDTLIQFPSPPVGRAGGPPPGGRAMNAPAAGPARGNPPPGDGRGRGGPAPNLAQQRLASVKQDFARLMLGAFATSFPSYPLTFKYAAIGEAPEGQADILDVTGPANFSARFVVQRETHLPVMLIWQLPTPGARPMAGPPPAAGPPAAGAPPQAPPTEYRMYYADFRDVNGVKWPFRIRRAIGADTIEETTFDRVRFNVKIDARKFEVPK